jgi:hypothetical protein
MPAIITIPIVTSRLAAIAVSVFPLCHCVKLPIAPYNSL